MLMRFRQRLFC